jgi:uncharacterized UBP type Zn finger protein
MSTKEIQPFVVENGINTCYMDSLFMALFYSPSNISYNMLETDPTDPTFLYLQELIKTNFIEPVRKNTSISANTINEIRNFAFINGWKTNTPDEIFEQQDVTEFFTFLMNNFNMSGIDIKRNTISEGLPNKSDDGTVEKIPFITLNLPNTDDKKELTVKALLEKWFTDNPVDVKRETINNKGQKVTEVIKALNIFKVSNVPTTIPLVINRFANINDKKNMTAIDIMQKIKLPCHEEYENMRWVIHSVVCHTGNTIRSGHYYALLNHANKWLLFDDLAVPCMQTITMSHTELMNKVKSECIFVIYKFDES